MKIVRFGLVVAVVALAVLSTGCATISSGSTQGITIHSKPTGAHVRYGHQSGTTPIMLQVDKGLDEPIEVTYGRHRKVIILSRIIDSKTYLNLIPPLWPGFIIDAMSGAITEYEHNQILVDFKQAQLVRYRR